MNKKNIGKLYKFTKKNYYIFYECDNENFYMLTNIKIKNDNFLLYIGQSNLKQKVIKNQDEFFVLEGEKYNMYNMHQFLYNGMKICCLKFDSCFEEIEYE